MAWLLSFHAQVSQNRSGKLFVLSGTKAANYKYTFFIFDFVVTLKAFNTGPLNLCDMALYQQTQKETNKKIMKSILYVCRLYSSIEKKMAIKAKLLYVPLPSRQWLSIKTFYGQKKLSTSISIIIP